MLHSYDKQVTDRLGWVAERCPMCRAVRAHALSRVRQVQHMALMPMGQGQVQDHQAKCAACGMVHSVDIRRYVGSLPDLPQDLGELVISTHPDLEAREPELLGQDRLLRSDSRSLSTLDRRLHVLESLFIAAPTAEAQCSRNAGGDFWTTSGWILFLLVPAVLLGLAFLVAVAITDHVERIVGPVAYVAGAIAGLGLLLTVAATWTLPRRMIRRHIVPMLCCGLAPLKPSATDLELALQAADLRGVSYVRRINATSLTQALASWSDPFPGR